MTTPNADIARWQLRRLETLTDCVYALALVLVIQWLPLPEESSVLGEQLWLFDLFAERSGNLISALIGLAFVIIYWLRTNQLLAYLDRTDGVHTALSIASVFFLLFLLYIVRVSAEGRRRVRSVDRRPIGERSAGEDPPPTAKSREASAL